MEWNYNGETFKGTPEEIAAIRHILLSDRRSQTVEIEWNNQSFNKYYASLSEKAQAAMVEIAKQPDGYDVTELAKHFGKSNKELGGSLSSITVQWQKDFQDRPKPVVRDFKRNIYIMPTEIAVFLQEHV